MIVPIFDGGVVTNQCHTKAGIPVFSWITGKTMKGRYESQEYSKWRKHKVCKEQLWFILATVFD